MGLIITITIILFIGIYLTFKEKEPLILLPMAFLCFIICIISLVDKCKIQENEYIEAVESILILENTENITLSNARYINDKISTIVNYNTKWENIYYGKNFWMGYFYNKKCLDIYPKLRLSPEICVKYNVDQFGKRLQIINNNQ